MDGDLKKAVWSNNIIAQKTTRPIPSFPGYLASSDGFIFRKRSLKKYKGQKYKNLEKVSIVKQQLHGRYFMTPLFLNGKKFLKTTHSLILEAFLGKKPEKMVCCHGPLGTKDNSTENLSYGSASKNNGDDKFRDGKGKLNREMVNEIKILKGKSSRIEICKKYGISKSMVTMVWNGWRWK